MNIESLTNHIICCEEEAILIDCLKIINDPEIWFGQKVKIDNKKYYLVGKVGNYLYCQEIKERPLKIRFDKTKKSIMLDYEIYKKILKRKD